MLVNTKARIGVFSIALGAYLPQFPSLVPEFEAQYEDFKKRIPDSVELIDGGLVTTKELAVKAGDKFRAADVDLVILQLLTYATSYNMLPAVRDLDVPVVLVNLQKKQAPDYANTDTVNSMPAEPWARWLPTLSAPASAMRSSPAWWKAETPWSMRKSPTGAVPLRCAAVSATRTLHRSAVPTPA